MVRGIEGIERCGVEVCGVEKCGVDGVEKCGVDERHGVGGVRGRA